VSSASLPVTKDIQSKNFEITPRIAAGIGTKEYNRIFELSLTVGFGVISKFLV
jgi:hypothetical protein